MIRLLRLAGTLLGLVGRGAKSIVIRRSWWSSTVIVTWNDGEEERIGFGPGQGPVPADEEE